MNIIITFCIFLLLTFSLVHSKEICDYNDLACFTRGAKDVYKTLLTGSEGFNTIKPLVLDNISAKIPGLKYVLTNVTLYPMENCDPHFTFWNETNYEYVLECSELNLHANVVAKGRLGPVDVNSNDYVTIKAVNYSIILKAQQTIIDSNEDQTKRIILTKTNFVVDTEPKGNIIFESVNNFGLTKAQVSVAKEFYKNNWEVLENTFKNPTINEFMTGLTFNKIAPYLKATPMDKILSKEEK